MVSSKYFSKVGPFGSLSFEKKMLVPRGASLMADLEAAGGTDGRGAGDPSRQISVLQRLVQAANQCPADIQAHLGDILKVTYFQTGVKPLRTLSYALLTHCAEGYASQEIWDNVVGSAMKDVEAMDAADLQCAAIKALCLIPVAKVRIFFFSLFFIFFFQKDDYSFGAWAD